MTQTEGQKPLGIKAYGSIPHLPSSRLGPGDHHVSPGQARICCEKVRDRHDLIVVQEKLDGSCTAVAKINGAILPLGRAGYLAYTSRYEQHRLFAEWVWTHVERFDVLLQEGERLIGEWLAQAHGTRYHLTHEPWVPFDLMVGQARVTLDELTERVTRYGFTPPHLVHAGGPISVDAAMEQVEPSWHGAIDPVEGVVWRVERKGQVDFLAKYVRPDKIDGVYLPEQSGKDAIWHWGPCKEQHDPD